MYSDRLINSNNRALKGLTEGKEWKQIGGQVPMGKFTTLICSWVWFYLLSVFFTFILFPSGRNEEQKDRSPGWLPQVVAYDTI